MRPRPADRRRRGRHGRRARRPRALHVDRRRPADAAGAAGAVRPAAGRGSPDGRQEWHNWIARRRSDGRAAGYVQATVTQEGRRAEIAWVVGTAFQGHGYATAAAVALVGWLDERGAETVVAHVHPDNHASAVVAERAGLRPTDRYDDGERLWMRPGIG